MSKGKLEIYIGPNGFGKTAYLKNKKDASINSILIPTEIKYEDETKDTTEKPITMDILLHDILFPKVINEQESFENAIDTIVKSYEEKISYILKDVTKHNGKDFNNKVISKSTKKEYKGLLKIDNKFIKNNIGSGQSTLFLLKMLSISTRENIFLDEPEKFCHPGLLNEIAKEIRSLIDNNKNVFIVTHSPELVKLLDWKFENLYIFNEFKKDEQGNDTFDPNIKQINLDKLINNNDIKKISHTLKNNGSKDDAKIIAQYLLDKDKLKKYLKIRRNDFIDLLFTNNIYLVEGQNDNLFLQFKLDELSERKVLQTFSKFIMPMYLFIFNEIKGPNSTINVIFDEDNPSNSLHKELNKYIISNTDKYIMIPTNIEVFLVEPKKKTIL